jgi:hypothetical protein
MHCWSLMTRMVGGFKQGVPKSVLKDVLMACFSHEMVENSRCVTSKESLLFNILIEVEKKA